MQIIILLVTRLAITAFFAVMFCAFLFSTDPGFGSLSGALQWKHYGSYIIVAVPIWLWMLVIQNLLAAGFIKYSLLANASMAWLLSILMYLMQVPKPPISGLLLISSISFLYFLVSTYVSHYSLHLCQRALLSRSM